MRKRLRSLVTGLLFAAVIMAAIPVMQMASAVPVLASSDTYTVVVNSGYLALRSSPVFDSKNEIGRLYSGDVVEVRDYSGSTYWYVYSWKYDRCGYVNCNYLDYSGSPSPGGTRYNVSVSSGYLALRNAKAFDSRNEIGRLYNGDYVLVQDSSDPTYWWVYSPKHDAYGYVNRNYLAGAGGSSSYYDGTEYCVCVSSGYLALRNAKAFDSRNEIGRLYNGDSVYVQDSSDPTYWWVYSPKYDRCGYVNRNYLDGAGSSFTCTVSVATGYLALRTSPSYDSRNEIGCLYTGDTVEVLDSSGSTYWWVYSPKLNKSGYVNKNYLY